MKLKLLSFFIALISWADTKAQLVIDVGKDGYFINTQKIEYPAARKSLTSILGNDYRVFNGNNTIYTYDQLGLRLYEPPGSNIIQSLYVDFTNGPYKFSSKQPFEGNFKINGYKIDKGFTRDSISNIPNLFFDQNGSIEYGYHAVTFNDVTLFFLFTKEGSIKSIDVGFSDIKGDFQTRSEKSDAHTTLINLDFKYERGVFNDGKKVGVWEYYDTSNQLALRYDHDASTILYLKKINDDFVIKKGVNWDRVKLDIYPRVIGSDDEFRTALGKLIDYPALARTKGITGKVYVSFIIDKTGGIQDIKVEKDIGGNCGTAVVNALTLLKISWTHAVKNNLNYDSRLIIPVTFAFGLDNNTLAIPSEEKLFLPDAYLLPELSIVAWGTSKPIKN